MHRPTLPFLTTLSCGLLLLALTAPAFASSQHTVTMEWVFSGSSCALSTVVVSATSCDGDDIATELVSEMSASGFPNPGCGYSVNDQWDCLSTMPSGCTLVDTTMSLKPGAGCTYDNIRGQNNDTGGLLVVFSFHVF